MLLSTAICDNPCGLAENSCQDAYSHIPSERNSLAWIFVCAMYTQGPDLFSVCVWRLNDYYAYYYAGLLFTKHIAVYQKGQGLCAEVQWGLYVRKSHEGTWEGQ